MIVVVDYDMGNLHSIAKALEYVGGEVAVSSDPRDLIAAEKIVLPGVGAFPDGMAHLLRDKRLYDALLGQVKRKKKPILGICLGMQLLASTSEEFRVSGGLGWIEGDVKRFDVDHQLGLRVPHVGWNNVRIIKSHPLLAGIPDQTDFYFVHSYHFISRQMDDRDIVGTCDYGGPFTAIIGRDNIFATQFHPEKSQRYGLTLLENFIRWDGVYVKE